MVCLFLTRDCKLPLSADKFIQDRDEVQLDVVVQPNKSEIPIKKKSIVDVPPTHSIVDLNMDSISESGVTLKFNVEQQTDEFELTELPTTSTRSNDDAEFEQALRNFIEKYYTDNDERAYLYNHTTLRQAGRLRTIVRHPNELRKYLESAIEERRVYERLNEILQKYENGNRLYETIINERPFF